MSNGKASRTRADAPAGRPEAKGELVTMVRKADGRTTEVKPMHVAAWEADGWVIKEA